MALIVEDGTGKPDAESYASVAQLRAYCTARGLALGVAATDDTKAEQQLRQATDYLAAYGSYWQGARAVPGQALDWPRTGVMLYGAPVASDSVPRQVIDAACLLAQKATSGPLVKDEGREKAKVKVGPIETEYTPGSSQQTKFVDVGRTLAPLLAPSAGANAVPLRRV